MKSKKVYTKPTAADIANIYQLFTGNEITKGESTAALKEIGASESRFRKYVLGLALSPAAMRQNIESALDLHLYYAHFARVKLVSSLLPQADTILDLGGANGSLYDMGYPYKFKKITVVDLAPELRDDMYKEIDLKKTITPNGPIDVYFGDMADLSFASDNSVDMVWSGESIEHIDEAAGTRMIKEAYRVLKPGGHFCLDTPNRLLTEVHTRDSGGGFIHPEHKIEYYPKDLVRKLRTAGFKIVESRGIREMQRTISSGQFDYSDYILGAALPTKVESAYMQYYHCVKPEPFLVALRKRIPKKLRSVLHKIRGNK